MAQLASAPTPLALSRNPAQLRKALTRARAETERWRLQHAELQVAYAELLTHARAAVAAAARGELAPTAYIAGHLEEIGLAPAPDAIPDAVLAEGLAVAGQIARRHA